MFSVLDVGPSPAVHASERLPSADALSLSYPSIEMVEQAGIGPCNLIIEVGVAKDRLPRNPTCNHRRFTLLRSTIRIMAYRSIEIVPTSVLLRQRTTIIMVTARPGLQPVAGRPIRSLVTVHSLNDGCFKPTSSWFQNGETTQNRTEITGFSIPRLDPRWQLPLKMVPPPGLEPGPA